MSEEAKHQGTPCMPWGDRIVAWIGAWALRRLYGACPPEDFEPDCPSCKSGYLIREMEDIARGR